jgi:hypothetical protein
MSEGVQDGRRVAPRPEESPKRLGGRRPGRRRRIWLVVFGVIALWAVLAAWMLWSAANDARDGMTSMEDFSALASEDIATFVDSIGGQSDDVAEETGAAQLQQAADSFGSAHDSISSPVLAPLRVLPVLGRQLRSVQALSGAAATASHEASVAFADLTAILESSTHLPEDRLATTAEVERVLTTLQANLGELDLGPSEALIGPLANARQRFEDEYAQVTETLDTAVTAVTGVHDFLEGPNRYLVLAANNAEMRAGSGMYLQIGTMDVDAGLFALSDFEATADLALPAPGAELPPEVMALWAPLEPTQDWRNVNVTPRFDQSAAAAAKMWEAAGRGPVDGVAAIDVVGLRRLLEIIGPVEVDTVDGPMSIDAENVESHLLLEQYRDADDDAVERRSELGRVATAVFESFNARGVSATQLLQVLQDTGEGRHLLMWSSEPTQQAAWEVLGAAGQLSEDDLLLSVLNRGGNKLDQFLGVHATLTSVTTGGLRRVSVQVDLGNRTPEGLPRYVAGPFPGTDLVAGDYLGLLALTVPAGAGNPSVEGTTLAATGLDGDNKVIVADVLLGRGQSTTITISFDLPTAWTSLDVQASARVPPVTWTAGGRSWDDDRPETVELDALG